MVVHGFKAKKTRSRMDAYLIEQQASWLVPKAETASLAMMQALLQKADYVGVRAESMASLGLFRKVAIDSNIRFGPIAVVWNREHVSTLFMDFIACLKAHARSLPAAPVLAPPSA